MARFILHVKEAPEGKPWTVEDFRTPGVKRPGEVRQVLAIAETGQAAREAFEAEQAAAGAVHGRGPDTPDSDPVDVNRHQYQVLKVEAL